MAIALCNSDRILRSDLSSDDASKPSTHQLPVRRLQRTVKQQVYYPVHTASDVIKAGTRQELQSILDSIWFKSPESPLEFHGFLELPQELRDLVYEFYFEGSFIGSEHQLPLDCCNLPGLLSTSRQLYEESKEFMYKHATLKVSLAKEHAPTGAPDFPSFCEGWPAGPESCSVAEETIRSFRKVFFYHTKPRKEWRYLPAIVRSYLNVLDVDQHVRVELDIGKLSQDDVVDRMSRSFATCSFGDVVRRRCDEACEKNCNIHRPSAESLKEFAARLRAFSDKVLDVYCMLVTIWQIGRQARHSGLRISVLSEDGREKDLVADNTFDLVGEAESFLKGFQGTLRVDGAWKGWGSMASSR